MKTNHFFHVKESLVHVSTCAFADTRLRGEWEGEGDQMARRGKGRSEVSVLSAVKAIVATGLAAFTIRDAPWLRDLGRLYNANVSLKSLNNSLLRRFAWVQRAGLAGRRASIATAFLALSHRPSGLRSPLLDRIIDFRFWYDRSWSSGLRLPAIPRERSAKGASLGLHCSFYNNPC